MPNVNTKNGSCGSSPASGGHVKNVKGQNPTAPKGSEKGIRK